MSSALTPPKLTCALNNTNKVMQVTVDAPNNLICLANVNAMSSNVLLHKAG